MYVSQHMLPNVAGSAGQRPLATSCSAARRRSQGRFRLHGPTYQFRPTNNDGVHLSALGYQMLAKRWQRSITNGSSGSRLQPVQPTTVERSGRVVTVHFHSRRLPQLGHVIDAPAIPEWFNGAGSSCARVVADRIASVAIRATPCKSRGADLRQRRHRRLALSTGRPDGRRVQAVDWGQLRDSDPLVGRHAAGKPELRPVIRAAGP